MGKEGVYVSWGTARYTNKNWKVSEISKFHATWIGGAFTYICSRVRAAVRISLTLAVRVNCAAKSFVTVKIALATDCNR